MYDEDRNAKEDASKSRVLVRQPPANSPLLYNNLSYNQAPNYGPSILSPYHGNQFPPPLSPCFLNNAPIAPSYISVPGIPQYGSSPGFLTAAGYQLGHNLSPIGGIGGMCLPGVLCPPRHAGMPLHAAAIVGDRQKVVSLLQDDSIKLESRDQWGRVALAYAVLGNHQELVDLLLSAGAKPDATDAKKCTPLHFAAYKGNLGAIKSLLHAAETKSAPLGESQGRVWLAQDMRSVTPLHHAAHHNNQKCLQALLKYASPGTLDMLDYKKRTPLHWAAAYGSDENVKLLIKHGANNLLPDQEGKTPLHWAAMSKAPGAKECVRTLIAAAPSSVNWQDFDGITALHLAVAETRLDAVDVILSVPKCNVDLTDNQFRTALHWACSRGVTTIVGRLLSHDAHPSAVDLYGATPLHYAAQLNHSDTVELLVRRPCVRDDPSKEGYTALLWAAARGADTAITAMVKHGASLTKADPRGCTPLHVAAGAGHVSTVGVLLRLKAPVNVSNNDGLTPLLHAAQAGHAHIVKLLAKSGASLDHRDNEGQCALHHAVLSGHLYLAQILIKAGTSVNVRDYSGRTPLHMAAYKGLCDILFLLLENRGDVNARDHEGQSALHWAAQQGHLGAVNTLLEFHAYPNFTQTTIDRYTPLDCAYVAEQLEVAQVLMEAGGLSVTKIWDIAAVRIQAIIRGYLARRSYKDLKSSDKMSVESIDGLETGKVARRSKDSVMKETSNKLQSKNAWETNQALHKTQDSIGLNNKKNEKIANASVLREKLEAEILQNSKSSEASCPNSARSHKHPPVKNIHHARRSKVIGSNIKLGARKKTLRELKLPDLGELGIKATNIQETGSSYQIDGHVDENDDPLAMKTRNSLLTMGEALRYPRNVASLLVTANIGNSSKVDVHRKESADTRQEIEDIRDMTRHSAPCKITNPDHFNSRQQEDASEPGSWEAGKKEERKRLLQEGFARSIEVAHKETRSPRKDLKTPRRQVLSASARRVAEEKWSNKLASLTLQVQPSNSAKPASSFSYNLTSPQSAKPST